MSYVPYTSFTEGIKALYNKLVSKINVKANNDSPTLTGTPYSTTPDSGDNSTRIATTNYVQTRVNENNTVVTNNTAQANITNSNTYSYISSTTTNTDGTTTYNHATATTVYTTVPVMGAATTSHDALLKLLAQYSHYHAKSTSVSECTSTTDCSTSNCDCNDDSNGG